MFLDEVDALSPKGQVALLRFMRDQQYRPLGGGREINANVRVITASNTDLARLAELGQFRTDLLFRLKILHLELPPLRQRRADVRLLAEHFFCIYGTPAQQPLKALHPETLAWMETYGWPGNVRELENLIHRELLLSDGPEIRIPPLALAQGSVARRTGAGPGAPASTTIRPRPGCLPTSRRAIS